MLKYLAIVAATALVAIGSPALAADYSTFVPWGDWAAQLVIGLAGLTAPVVAFGLRKLPKTLAETLTQWRVNEALEKAINFGINATAGAVRGKTLSVNTGNAVVKMALDYAIEHTPGIIDEFGERRIREKLLARISLEEAADLPAPVVSTRP